MKVRDPIRLLETAGWALRATKGSHRQFKHPDKRMIVTLSRKNPKDMWPGFIKPNQEEEGHCVARSPPTLPSQQHRSGPQ